MEQKENSNKGSIAGVSLGPGDPELITVKGLKLLQQADKVYFPGSRFSDGRKDSYSLSILKHYDLDPNKLTGFYLTMSLDRKEAEVLYYDTFLKIKEDYQNGMNVVIVSEGDASTFSSFSYLLHHFQQHHVPFHIQPGITSFALAAACHHLPLSIQNEKMVIIPRIQNEDEVVQCLTSYDTVILMKIRSVKTLIFKVLKTWKAHVFYGERLGTKEEFISTNLEEIEQRDIPYFALMIIKKSDSKRIQNQVA
ncbi:MAG: precorrin-2 C(20)-methyltransferase [Bacteroidota bacterium]